MYFKVVEWHALAFRFCDMLDCFECVRMFWRFHDLFAFVFIVFAIFCVLRFLILFDLVVFVCDLVCAFDCC